MTLRTGHGTGAGVPRIEVLPADELPTPDPQPAATGPIARRPDGTFDGSDAAREAGRRAGLASARARANRLQLLGAIGLRELAVDDAFYAYDRAGRDFAEAHIAQLAAMWGGACGPGPSSIVKTAAMQLAASRFLYDRANASGDAKTFGEASRLGDASRQNLLAAYELAAREAKAQPAGGDSIPPGFERAEDS